MRASRWAALAAAGVAAAACADELPLPAGPTIEGPIARPGQADPVLFGKSEPLWEFGLGAAVVRFNDYRGSDHYSLYALPLPFLAYRGRFLRADKDGTRAIIFAGRKIEVDVSASASTPTKSSGSDVREGMPDLAGSFEIGPNLNVEMWKSASDTFKLDLRLPVREVVTIERSPRALGVTFSPNLNLDVRRFAGSWNLGLLAGPVFASRRFHEYYYSVAPQFATADRPIYSATGGYAGWRFTTAFSRRIGNAWLGGFVRYDDLHGAVFADSPLVRQKSSVTAGFGVSWIFAVSSQRVVTSE